LQTVAVFGGTGFLGRRVVRHLALRHSVRAVARHRPDAREAEPGPELVQADIKDESSIRAAVTGVFAVVNVVSLYVERGDQTFRSIHVEAASRLARVCGACGVRRLVHVSGVGAAARARSAYIRSRGEGEDAVRAAFPAATIVRPCVMFGPDDAFLTPLLGLIRRLPIIPLFGRGRTRLQPAHVEDVAESIARILDAADPAAIYEFGGPDTFSYEALLRRLAAHAGVTRVFLPLPFSLWQVVAFGSELLPEPLVTRNQVELMQSDNVASADMPGLRELGIEPQGIDRVLESIR